MAAFAPGTMLGPYEIVAPIGAGGMGEVYRAHDPRLDRDVALKVLPEAVAGHAERLARFQREARTLAALSHPHIATVLEGGVRKAGVTHLKCEPMFQPLQGDPRWRVVLRRAGFED